MVGVCCYILAITVPWPETQFGTSAALVVASLFPILTMVYSYTLYCFVAEERESVANQLGLLFAIAAFTTVLAMIVVQLAVGAGLGDITRDLNEQTARALRRGLRMVDLGLDVAWDMLIGTALIFSGVAIRKRSGLGLGWGIPSVALGSALIGLNAATFPWPPGAHGLFDIGPLIGVFVLFLSSRLTFLGVRASRTTTTSA
jgi:hypothetical protein